MKKALFAISFLGAFGLFSIPTALGATIYSATSSAGTHTLNSILPTANGTVAQAKIYVPSHSSAPYVWIGALGAGTFATSAGTFPLNTFINSEKCTALSDGIDNWYNCNFAIENQYKITNYTVGNNSNYLYFVLCSNTTLHGSCTPVSAFDNNINNGINGTGYNWKGSITDTSVFIPLGINLNIDTFATSTVIAFCDTNVPYDNSSLIQATLTYIPNGICRVGVFLTIPSQESLDAFPALASSTAGRFPFSYIKNVVSVWGSLTASTTANSPTFTYNLANLGLGSTTAMGNILPNATVFSSSTVQAYFPSGAFTALKALASIAIILVLIGHIYTRSRDLLK